MRIGLRLVVLIAVVTMTAIVFTFGRGPVGPESVVRKDVHDRVREAYLDHIEVTDRASSRKPVSWI